MSQSVEVDLIECQELAIAQRMVSNPDFSISTIELQPVDTPGDIDFHTATKRADHQGGPECIPGS